MWPLILVSCSLAALPTPKTAPPSTTGISTTLSANRIQKWCFLRDCLSIAVQCSGVFGGPPPPPRPPGGGGHGVGSRRGGGAAGLHQVVGGRRLPPDEQDDEL